jgi:predicted TIM-barrel fold metal-dependent hydrolase
MLPLFDANCQVGRWGTPAPGQPISLEETERELRRAGAVRALAYHALAKEYSPLEGNEALAREAKQRSWLEPCWVALPHHTGEFPRPKEFLDMMREAGVKAVRLFPAAHNYKLSEWCSGELLDALEYRGAPVVLGLDQTNWEEIHAVCGSHPQLRLILSEPGYRSARFLYPLLERFEQLRFEITSFHVHRGLEEVCRLFGADRVLYGSGLPLHDPAGTAAMILFSRLEEKAKRAVGHDNLARLIEEVEAHP